MLVYEKISTLKKLLVKLLYKSHSPRNFKLPYLIAVLIAQGGQMVGTVVADVTYVLHLALVTVSDPLDLLGAILLDAVHLLRVILAQTLQLLTLVILDVVEHLVDLLGAWSDAHVPTAQTPFLTAASTMINVGVVFLF